MAASIEQWKMAASIEQWKMGGLREKKCCLLEMGSHSIQCICLTNKQHGDFFIRNII